MVLKDFDIAAKAGGPGKAIVETFTAEVRDHTLKIHLYWAGRGTTGIPERGVYGPLISAISVDPSMSIYFVLRTFWILVKFLLLVLEDSKLLQIKSY